MKGLYLTAAELAASGFAGVPREKSPARRYALRQKWPSRNGARKGQVVIEFLLPEELADALPVPAKTNFACAGGPPTSADLVVDAGTGTIITAATQTEIAEVASGRLDEHEARRHYFWEQFERRPARQKKAAEKRAVPTAKAVDLIRNGWSAMKVYRDIATEFSVSVSALRGWTSAVEGFHANDFAAVLVDERHGRPRGSLYSSRIDDLFRAAFLRKERPAARSSYDHMKDIALREGLSVPSLITLMRHMRRDLTPQAIVVARYGQKALEASYPAQERDRSALRAMQALQADGYVFVTYVKWPDSTIARPCMVSWIDLYSGAILAWRIDRTENLDSVRLSFGQAIARGIPESVWLDSGMGFAGKQMSGRIPHRFRFKLMPEEPAGIFELFGIRVHWSIPGHGQSKPIERLHLEYRDRLDKHPKLAGAMAREGAVALELFVQVVEEQVAAINARPGRRSNNCAGRSFWQTFVESYERGPVQKATDEQRRLCLLAAERVTLNRLDSTFRLCGNRYYSRMVAETPELRGGKITVRFDPQRLREPVGCYHADGRFIDIADCILPVGFNDTESARHDARMKRQNLKAHKLILANERRMGVGELNKLLPTAPAPTGRANSKVVRLFRPTIETPGQIEFTGEEPLEASADSRSLRYRELKQRAEAAPDTLDADDWATIKIFEAGLRPIQGRA